MSIPKVAHIDLDRPVGEITVRELKSILQCVDVSFDHVPLGGPVSLVVVADVRFYVCPHGEIAMSGWPGNIRAIKIANGARSGFVHIFVPRARSIDLWVAGQPAKEATVWFYADPVQPPVLTTQVPQTGTLTTLTCSHEHLSSIGIHFCGTEGLMIGGLRYCPQ